jgi:hypothetical protein
MLAVLCISPAIAQTSQGIAPPKYDLKTEAKMKRTVEELKLPATLIRPERGSISGPEPGDRSRFFFWLYVLSG